MSFWSCVIRLSVVFIMCYSIKCRSDHLLFDRVSFWSFVIRSNFVLIILFDRVPGPLSVLSQSNLELCKLTPGVRTNTEAFSDPWEEIITAVLSFWTVSLYIWPIKASTQPCALQRLIHAVHTCRLSQGKSTNRHSYHWSANSPYPRIPSRKCSYA